MESTHDLSPIADKSFLKKLIKKCNGDEDEARYLYSAVCGELVDRPAKDVANLKTYALAIADRIIAGTWKRPEKYFFPDVEFQDQSEPMPAQSGTITIKKLMAYWKRRKIVVTSDMLFFAKEYIGDYEFTDDDVALICWDYIASTQLDSRCIWYLLKSGIFKDIKELHGYMRDNFLNGRTDLYGNLFENISRQQLDFDYHIISKQMKKRFKLLYRLHSGDVIIRTGKGDPTDDGIDEDLFLD
jgi:hypothetical protein